jgi:uncharacterized protein (DUF1015 family)
MVLIYPFNVFASAEGGSQQRQVDNLKSNNLAPNRFSLFQTYDRSVNDDDSMGLGLGQTGHPKIHSQEANPQTQTPVVVLSRRRGREKEQEPTSAAVCSEHDITFRNVKEFIDGGILELVREQSFLIYSQDTEIGGGRRHRQIGICASLAVEDCLKGSIKRHEKVTKETPAHKRPHSLSHKPWNVDPVMMMYRQSDNCPIQQIISRIINRDIPVSMQAKSRRGSHLSEEEEEGGGVSNYDEHKIWSITNDDDIEAIKTAFLGVESLYIAG